MSAIMLTHEDVTFDVPIARRDTAYVLRHGRPVYETWDPDPDNCQPWDGVDYIGHRLGQVWAHQKYPLEPPIRI